MVQETWLVAVRRVADFDPAQGNFDAWLKGIAANVLKNQRRRWQRDAQAEWLEFMRVAGFGPAYEVRSCSRASNSV